MQYLVEKVELSGDKERLIFHTKDNDDLGCLWSALAGQLLDVTEGRKSIPYNLPEDTPVGTILDIEGDTHHLISVLSYLEVELKLYKYLTPGTTNQIQKDLDASEKSTSIHSNDAKKEVSVDQDDKYSPK